MKDTRRNRVWTLAGVVALALTAGVVSKRVLVRRELQVPRSFAVETDLHDAVAAPIIPAVGLVGKPVPTSWFKAPAQRRAEMDSTLLSSRRRRALACRVAVQ